MHCEGAGDRRQSQPIAVAGFKPGCMGRTSRRLNGHALACAAADALGRDSIDCCVGKRLFRFE